MENHPLLGIDLGNGYIKISQAIRVRDGEGNAMPQGLTITETVPIKSRMSLEKKRRVFGGPFQVEVDAIDSFKRLCLTASDQTDGVDHISLIKQRFQISHNNVFRQMMGMILGYIRRNIMQSNVYAPIDTVVAVPRWYTELHLQELADAMVIGGLNPVGFVTDIVAVAFSRGIAQSSLLADAATSRTVAFLDIGMTDSSATVASFTQTGMTIHEVVTDPDIGGRDVDRILFQYIISQVDGESKRTPQFRSSVLRKCSELKKEMCSSTHQAWIDLTTLTRNSSDTFLITQSDFKNLLNEWLERVFDPLLAVVTMAGLETAELDAIELVGGSSNLFCVREYAEQLFGDTSKISTRPEVSAAEGAARTCDLIKGRYGECADVLYDIRTGPLTLPFRLTTSDNLGGSGNPWTPLPRDNRLDDTHLVSLIETELALEELDSLLIKTEDVHAQLVQAVGSLSEKLNSADFKKHPGDRIEPIRQALDASIQWIVSTPPEEMTKLLYEAHLESLRNATDVVDQVLSKTPKSQAPTNTDSATRETLQHFKKGYSLLTRFKETEQIQDLDECIPSLEVALAMLTPHSPELKRYLVGTALAHSLRFSRTGKDLDINRAVDLYCRAVELMEDSWDADEVMALGSAAPTFLHRYDFLKQLEDVEEAIRLLELVVVRCQGTRDEYRPGYISNLGTALARRFRAIGRRRDLVDAERLCREAVEKSRSSPSGGEHVDLRWNTLMHLSIVLRIKADEFGEVVDAKDAVKCCEKAIYEAEIVCTKDAKLFHALGAALLTLFTRVGNIADISRAISACDDAIKLAEMDPERPKFLACLSACLQARFSATGTHGDIQRSIGAAHEALDSNAKHTAATYTYLHTLGNAYLFRFLELGEMVDINSAVNAFQKAAKLTKGHHDQPLCFTMLGQALTTRYEAIAEITDVEKAIAVERKGVKLLSNESATKPLCLTTLAKSLSKRFSRLGQKCDIEEAIAMEKEAHRLLPSDHPERHKFLANLGMHCMTKYESTKDLQDVEDATTAYRNAVECLSVGHPDAGLIYNGVGLSYIARFENTGDIDSLRQGIDMYKIALDQTKASRPERKAYLLHLGNAFIHLFDKIRNINNLDHAIIHLREALSLSPPDHPDRTIVLGTLARSLVLRHKTGFGAEDVEEAIQRYSEAATCRTGVPWIRFTHAKNWVICAKGVGHRSLRDAYECWLDILPRVAWLGLKLDDRRVEIAKMGHIACDAAADAIALGDYQRAVVWLEKGRFIIWGQGLQLRSPIDDLKAKHPDLAQKVEDISLALERSINESFGLIHVGNDVGAGEDNTEKIARRQRGFADAWDKLLVLIRKKEGFEKFLLSSSFQDLSKSAEKYPVAIINPSAARSDALLLLPSGHVQLVPLAISYREATDLVDHMAILLTNSGRTCRGSEVGRAVRPARAPRLNQWHDILGRLWKGVAKPVLDALKLSPSKSPSRLCWCPTGIFSRLPLHAAGDYSTKGADLSVHDYVISTYAPTLGLLRRKQIKPEEGRSKAVAVLAVGVSKTIIPKMIISPLPSVKEEMAVIKKIVPMESLVLLQDEMATKENILTAIKSCTSLHLACHAYQDLVNPLSSAFLVHGEKLPLSRLLQESLTDAEFAFLSACQTARGDENTPDEAMHLAGAMLFLGFRSVIATMWSIDDADGPIVTKAVYSALFSQPKFEGARAAAALHRIVGEMRAKQMSFEKWVPFISLGL